MLNYQYRNRFDAQDYRGSADLYHAIAPDLVIGGHWMPRWVDLAYLQMLSAQGEEVVDVHRDLLPVDELTMPADGVLAYLQPYLSTCVVGETITIAVSVHNPWRSRAAVVTRLIVPTGWSVTPDHVRTQLDEGAEVTFDVRVQAGAAPVHRARIAIDVSIGELRLGQHAEALVEVTTR